jgi:hypothetical protein
MGGQPGKPKPPGNPPSYPDDEEDEDTRPPIDEPPMPIPVPPVERPPAPMRFSRGRSYDGRAAAAQRVSRAA